MGAGSAPSRTFFGMDVKDIRRVLRHRGVNDDISETRRALIALGQGRVDEQEAWGPLYAQFMDFCWVAEWADCRELFDFWLAEIYLGQTTNAGDVESAVKALEATS